MKRTIALLSVFAISSLLTGCMSMKNFAKVIEAAGTKDKKIDSKLTGWNINWDYKSEPVQWNAPMTTTTNRTDGGFLVVPETTLRVEKTK